MDDDVEQYTALKRAAGVTRIERSTWIEIAGDDRLPFLNRLCTNQVDRLAPGQGCETFVLNAKGHVLGHGFVLARRDALLFRTAGGQAEPVLSHLDFYLIHDKVELRDRSNDWAELLVCGPQSDALLARLASIAIPDGRLGEVESDSTRGRVWILRAEPAPRSVFVLSGDEGALSQWWSLLIEAGARACGHRAWEAIRIELGWPLYGRDLDETNLPQELGRDAQAISFHKGCYLGQETVARIDSRGHVNRRLVGLRFAGKVVPAAGTELFHEGRPAGRVTSAACLPGAGSAVGLGYVGREDAQAGRELDSAEGSAKVVSLPMP